MYPGFAFSLSKHIINNKLEKSLSWVVVMVKFVFTFQFCFL